MSFLIEGEMVIKRFGQSRITQAKLYLVAAAIFLVPVVYYLYFSGVKLPVPDIYLIAIPAAIGVIVILIAELKTRLGSYYITNHRVISIKGAMKKTMDSCTYDKIVNVKIVQTFPQRILGMGTIDITTYQKTEIFLNSVSNPTKIERLIYSAMEQQSQKQSGQQRAAEARPVQQPQYQPMPEQEQPHEPVPEQQPPYQDRYRSRPAYEQQGYRQAPARRPPYQQDSYDRPRYQPQPPPEGQAAPPQSRPLLASERKLMQPPSEMQQPEPQPTKKKRFGLF